MNNSKQFSIDLGVVNFHFTHKCNYDCKFCHSNFFASREKEILNFEKWKKITELLKPYCKRINFAGGEPLLHKDLIGKLIDYNSQIGLISTIITNGYFLNSDWIAKHGKQIKAIGISCDSSNEKTQKDLGRGNGNHVRMTIERFKLINSFNQNENYILPKLNTVVNKLNYSENMIDFVLQTGVKRWKVFQLLTIEGENIKHSKDLIINEKQFYEFYNINKAIENYGVELVAENVNELTDTYIMIDPEGRFFSNNGNKYLFSEPIFEVGVEKALSQIMFNPENIKNLNRMFL
jgi:radical S-adenosyl methionine domain-containing protein 2